MWRDVDFGAENPAIKVFPSLLLAGGVIGGWEYKTLYALASDRSAPERCVICLAENWAASLWSKYASTGRPSLNYGLWDFDTGRSTMMPSVRAFFFKARRGGRQVGEKGAK